MERLIRKIDGMCSYQIGTLENVLERLYQYEESGITPQQMHEIDKLYAEKCRELAECKKQALPCSIGDIAWAVRDYRGKIQAQKGIVGEMFYNRNMELIVVVKNIARGKIGEKVFLSEAEAQQAVERMKGGAE